MYQVKSYLRVRRAVMVEGMSVREAARVFGLHRDTVRKMLAYSVPPGYRRQTPPRRPKLEPFTGVIDRILKDDHKVSKKQRHSAKRIFERLREEYGFDGQYTIVKDYVRESRRQSREMFVPLSHSPGYAQCDFGEALVVIGGVEQKAHCFVIDLPHSDGCFVKAYPAETTEAFLNGHVSAFAFLGGVPPEHPLRQYQAGGGEDTGRRPASAHPRLHRASVPLSVRGPVRLKLPSFLREYGKMAAQCAAEGVDHPQYLFRLAELEFIDRHQRMVERRIRTAGCPAVKSLDTFDFPAIPSLNKALVMELAQCEYIQRRDNVTPIGRPVQECPSCPWMGLLQAHFKCRIIVVINHFQLPYFTPVFTRFFSTVPVPHRTR